MTTTDIISELRDMATKLEEQQSEPIRPANFGTMKPIVEVCQDIVAKYGECDLTVSVAYNRYDNSWVVLWKLYDLTKNKFHESKTLAECLRKFECARNPPPPITDLKDAGLPPLVSAF